MAPPLLLAELPAKVLQLIVNAPVLLRTAPVEPELFSNTLFETVLAPEEKLKMAPTVGSPLSDWPELPVKLLWVTVSEALPVPKAIAPAANGPAVELPENTQLAKFKVAPPDEVVALGGSTVTPPP